MSITKAIVQPTPHSRGKRHRTSILPLVIFVLGLILSGATIVNGQVCGDLAETGKPDLADITLLIDHLFINHQPLVNAEVGNLDMCDSIDIADLALLIDLVYYSKQPACVGGWDCNPDMPHDVVQLKVAHRPNVTLGDSSLQIDLYVRNTLDLGGASMGFVWDLPKLSLDSARSIITTDQSAVDWDEALRQFEFAFYQSNPITAGLKDEYRLWASYYFSVNNWLTTDSVTFDLSQWNNGTVAKFVTPPYSDSTILGYVPRWDGPVVARDAGAYGDVDGSGVIDIGDVTQMINYLFLDGELTQASDIGNANACDGTDIADLRYLINMLFGEAPPLTDADCDYEVPEDLVGLRFTDWPAGGAGRRLVDQPLELQLFVRNVETVTDATMAFTWNNADLSMDSAKAEPVAEAGFTQSIVLYENNLLSLTNVGQLFNFKGTAGQSGPGVPGDATALRLWATYYFTLGNWDSEDDVLIDTLVFSDGSAFKFVNPNGQGHSPEFGFQPPYACCGVMDEANGYTGNIDWHQDAVGTKCDTTGRRNLTDITRMIDYVYVSKQILCCPKNGNVAFTYNQETGLEDGRINLADITRLIDKVYVSKEETELCQ